jgi:hypothetical protein
MIAKRWNPIVYRPGGSSLVCVSVVWKILYIYIQVRHPDPSDLDSRDRASLTPGADFALWSRPNGRCPDCSARPPVAIS